MKQKGDSASPNRKKQHLKSIKESQAKKVPSKEKGKGIKVIIAKEVQAEKDVDPPTSAKLKAPETPNVSNMKLKIKIQQEVLETQLSKASKDKVTEDEGTTLQTPTIMDTAKQGKEVGVLMAPKVS